MQESASLLAGLMLLTGGLRFDEFRFAAGGVEPAAVSIGMPVQVEFLAVDDDLTLPQFRPRA